MKRKLTQKEAIFYDLYKRFKKGDHEYVPVFKFMGEHYCEELNIWGFVSHECSARCSDLRRENPGLFEHQEIEGKSGARYFGYRLNPTANPALIEEPKLKKFWREVRQREEENKKRAEAMKEVIHSSGVDLKAK